MSLLLTPKRSSSLAVRLSGLLLGLLVLSGGGCTTEAQRMARIRTAFYGQDLILAEQLVAEGLKRSSRNDDLLKLERAMIELVDGRAANAEQTLRDVRDHFDYLEQQDVGEVAVSYLTDDQRQAYAGEDYEKILVRAFLALSNLLHDGTDASAYSLQMMDKQEQIIAAGGGESEENPKQDYPRVALAPYVYGMLREATHREYDDAQRSYEVVVNWQPQFTHGQQDWQRAVYGRHSSPGNGVLYVFALTGQGPYKEEVVETPSSAALLIAGELASHLGERSVTPNVAPVKVPRLVIPVNEVRSLAVSVDSRPVGVTTTVTDVASLAVSQYEAVFPRIVARAVLRRCLKKGVVYGAQEAADIPPGSLSSFAFNVAGVLWEASESADTRCWGLLPEQIQVLRVELPQGDFQIHLTPVLTTSTNASAVTRRVSIADGRNTYMLAAFPGPQLVGDVLVNQP